MKNTNDEDLHYPGEENMLHHFLGTYLDVNAYRLDRLAAWMRSTKGLELSDRRTKAFRLELQNAINKPGVITPEIYERWTSEDFETQDEVQKRLQEIWDACFGG